MFPLFMFKFFLKAFPTNFKSQERKWTHYTSRKEGQMYPANKWLLTEKPLCNY